ncbi:serine hydrolase domain-containing protein [Kribbella deserti]|uniref:Serine hydrolase domain-containing protein n=1 Tax=Kribbella deserti TaxID=1926257 RepID=A0ABV6QJG0_9ACTN
MPLAEVLTYFDSLLAFSRNYLRVPGIQAAVHAEGRIAFAGSYGLADVENDVALTDRHLFRIASHSKTFTATAIFQLLERGRLRLDDQAAQYVAELTDHPAGGITVRELLGHVGGLTRDSGSADFWQLRDAFPDRVRLLEILAGPDADVLAPNQRFKYSNIGFGLLGLIIEAATGTPYNAYVRKEIVDRLGLSDLGPELDPDRLGEYATGYSAYAYADRRVPIDHVDTRELASATGFYGTATDLASYFAAHLPDDDRLLTEASKRAMRRPQWPVKPDQTDSRYALGLAVLKVGERDLYGHGGGYPGHITRSLFDPEAGIAVSVLTNAIDGPALQLAQAFYKLLDLALDESPSNDDPAADLSRFTGRFANLWGVVDVALLGGRLYALHPTETDPTAEAQPLELAGDSSLRVDGGNGYGAPGECYEYTFGPNGVTKMRGASGLTYEPLDTFRLPERVTT